MRFRGLSWRQEEVEELGRGLVVGRRGALRRRYRQVVEVVQVEVGRLDVAGQLIEQLLHGGRQHDVRLRRVVVARQRLRGFLLDVGVVALAVLSRGGRTVRRGGGVGRGGGRGAGRGGGGA